MRMLKKTIAATLVLPAIAFGASPASANASVEVGGECDAEGNRSITMQAAVDARTVQWYIDGQPTGQPTSPFDPHTDAISGDGQTHVIEYRVLVPEGLDGDITEAFAGVCETTATTAPSTTAAPSTTEAPSTTAATSTSGNSTTAPTTAATTPSTASGVSTLYVTGIEADDSDGGLVVRTGPSGSNARITVLENGTAVTAIGGSEDGGWTQISSPVEGWVSLRYLTASPPPSVSTDGPTTTVESEERIAVEESEDDIAGDPGIAVAEFDDDEPAERIAVEEFDDDIAESQVWEDEPNDAILQVDPSTDDEGGFPLLPVLIGGGLLVAAIGGGVALRRGGGSGPVDTTPQQGPTVDATKSNGGKGTPIIFGAAPTGGSGPVDTTPQQGPTVDATKSNGGKGNAIIFGTAPTGGGGPVDTTPQGTSLNSTVSNSDDIEISGIATNGGTPVDATPQGTSINSTKSNTEIEITGTEPTLPTGVEDDRLPPAPTSVAPDGDGPVDDAPQTRDEKPKRPKATIKDVDLS